MKHRLIFVSIALWVATGLTGCAEGEDSRLAGATARAQAWMKARPIESPHEFLFLGVLHQRFGIPEFSGMLAGFDRAIEGMRTPDLLAARRILAPDQRVEEVGLERLASGINRIHSPSLFCDQGGRPRGYKRVLRESVEVGGYDLTHVALALIWMEALGCELPFEDPDAFREKVIEGVAALLEPRDGITDIEIEAGAFLYTLGEGHLVGPEFVDAFLEAQRSDGSWAFDSAAEVDLADWHASCLALWLLYELQIPDDEKRPVIPR